MQSTLSSINCNKLTDDHLGQRIKTAWKCAHQNATRLENENVCCSASVSIVSASCCDPFVSSVLLRFTFASHKLTQSTLIAAIHSWNHVSFCSKMLPFQSWDVMSALFQHSNSTVILVHFESCQVNRKKMLRYNTFLACGEPVKCR